MYHVVGTSKYACSLAGAAYESGKRGMKGRASRKGHECSSCNSIFGKEIAILVENRERIGEFVQGCRRGYFADYVVSRARQEGSSLSLDPSCSAEEGLSLIGESQRGGLGLNSIEIDEVADSCGLSLCQAFEQEGMLIQGARRIPVWIIDFDEYNAGVGTRGHTEADTQVVEAGLQEAPIEGDEEWGEPQAKGDRGQGRLATLGKPPYVLNPTTHATNLSV